MPVINGSLTPLLLWLVGGLLSLVNALLWLVLKAHKDSDDERWKGMIVEIGKLRTRLHDFAGQVGKIDQWQRFYDNDDGLINRITDMDKAISALTLVLHKDFVTKDEWENVRGRLHDITDIVSGLKAEVDMRKLRRDK